MQLTHRANFVSSSHIGSLSAHRRFCQGVVNEEIADLVKTYGIRNDSLDYQMKINACLSYGMMFAMQVNIKAFIRLTFTAVKENTRLF